ncbi:LysR family transcriptional regulator [Humisphaera borealis]|uniref:LysR family transcriptional regulator n=1 Tax=Humisphaera borealis TaxID=2807512 RepID=A0A7M2WWI1_9BACT|nr:LysR family transcriptional regulator [Humisphaera borealis]QOV89552.1 LysR family transcriptional regulator [Humisphaera borealis]
MLDAHSLKIFATVAENLSFTRAAETLFLTQSAVSHQVASLERQLDTQLFERRGRSVELTGPGRVLLDRARKVFAAIDEAAEAVKQASQPGLGRLRIGASPTACQYLVPESLREFRESFPLYSLAITPGDSPIVGERVAEGSIDLGIMIRPDSRDRGGRLQYHDLFEDELGFLVSPLHPWARAGKVDRRTMVDQRMVLYSRGSATYRAVERYFLKMKTPLRDPIELGSMEAIKELVKLGLGISVIAKWVARPELSQRSLIWLPLPGQKVRRRWAIAVATGKSLSLAEQTFVGLCRSAAANLMIDG